MNSWMSRPDSIQNLSHLTKTNRPAWNHPFMMKASMNIIPGLPDDVALLCLAKISHGYHGILECVCKRWREVVRSTEYSSLKAKYGWCGDWLFVLTEGQSATQLNAYDPEADRWHILPRTLDKLDLNHYGFQCVGVCRRFLVIGGYYAPRDFPYSVEFSATKDVVQFDPFKKKWSRLASMRVARSNFACAVIDEKVYVVGGHSSSSSSLQLAEVYDPLEDRWEDLPPLLVPYAACSGVSFNGRLYVIGRPENEIQTRTQMFDPVDQSWHSIENFSLYSNLNADPSPMAVVDGRFYTVDGWNGNTIYVRDVIHEEWSSIGSVPHVHLPHHSRPLEPFDFCVIGYRKYIYIVGGKVLRWDSLGIRRYDIVKLGQVKVCDPTVLPLTWKEVRPMRETRGTVIGSGIIEE